MYFASLTRACRAEALAATLVVAALNLSVACNSSSNSSGPSQGSERGACYPNGTCNAGLTCASNVCVDLMVDSGETVDTGVMVDSGAVVEAGPDGNSPPDSGSPPEAGGESGATLDATGSGPFPFTPSNVPAALLDFKNVDDVDLTSAQGCRIDTGAGTIGCGGTPIAQAFHFTSYVEVGADAGIGIPLGVFVAKSLKIGAGTTVNVVASQPASMAAAPGLVFMVAGDIDVLGTLQASVSRAGTTAWTAGGLFAGPGVGVETNTYSGGGGGFCGRGGANNLATGTGGASNGVAALVPLTGGSAGAGYTGLTGGGGAIQLVSGGALTVSGALSAPGAGGNSSSQGGGAGGAILLEALSIHVAGTLAANGGAAADYGAGGQDGTATSTPATSGSEGGGVGAAGTTINGADGQNTMSTAGGGGAAGRIRLNTVTGAATTDLGAVISPSPSTTCVTEGVITP